jgi:hypothetical protein
MTDEEIKNAIINVNELGGMTVNERLFASGLVDEFDKSLKNDKDKAKKILELLYIDNPSIEQIPIGVAITEE